jgi:hypothetical protein
MHAVLEFIELTACRLPYLLPLEEPKSSHASFARQQPAHSRCRSRMRCLPTNTPHKPFCHKAQRSIRQRRAFSRLHPRPHRGAVPPVITSLYRLLLFFGVRQSMSLASRTCVRATDGPRPSLHVSAGRDSSAFSSTVLRTREHTSGRWPHCRHPWH